MATTLSATFATWCHTFRVFVDAWYDGRLQDVIFHTKQQPEVKAMISSILAEISRAD